jgi:hypothetical protein
MQAHQRGPSRATGLNTHNEHGRTLLKSRYPRYRSPSTGISLRSPQGTQLELAPLESGHPPYRSPSTGISLQSPQGTQLKLPTQDMITAALSANGLSLLKPQGTQVEAPAHHRTRQQGSRRRASQSPPNHTWTSSVSKRNMMKLHPFLGVAQGLRANERKLWHSWRRWRGPLILNHAHQRCPQRQDPYQSSRRR